MVFFTFYILPFLTLLFFVGGLLLLLFGGLHKKRSLTIGGISCVVLFTLSLCWMIGEALSRM